MWVAVGIVGAAVVGGVASSIAADKGADAARDAANIQGAAAQNELELKQQQFDYQKQLNQPFYDKGLEGFNAYSDNIMSSVGADGKFDPTQSDAFKYREKDLGRTLRSLGRSNSSYGIDIRNRAAADEYDKQLSRLGDLTNIARGGASSLGSASGAYATGASQTLQNMGEGQANATLAGGMMQQNGLYNGINTGTSLANLGIKAYSQYNQPSSSGWSTTGGQYGDQSYNGDGQLWD